MSKPAKKESVWVAVSPEGNIVTHTVKWYRRESIKAITAFWVRQTWKQLYRQGWRVKRAWVVLQGEEGGHE